MIKFSERRGRRHSHRISRKKKKNHAQRVRADIDTK